MPPEAPPAPAGSPEQETAVATTDDVIILDPLDYERDPINRADVVQFADTLMGIHPNALQIGKLGMRTVAQLAIATGANPLPGTNGIHAWLDKHDQVCIQFGIGYWRDKADRAGGILWLSRPRPMSDDERADFGVLANQQASICMGAMKRDVFDLIRDAKEYDLNLSLEDAKREVARTGYGIVNQGELLKKGRNPQWSADLRAERDLLRQLVPANETNAPNVLDRSPAQLVTDAQNLDAYELLTAPENSTLPDDYNIEDANKDFFA